MDLKEFSRACFDNAVAHGFFDGDEVNIDQKLLLVVGEIAEAQEELRSGHTPVEIYFVKDKDGVDKPEGFPIEIADAVIRIFDLCEILEIDIEAALTLKHAYNLGRPFKHGKAF